MKIKIIMNRMGYLATSLAIVISACKKQDSVSTASAISTSSTIAVAASISDSSQDSLYIIQTCERGSTRESIGEENLPASVSTYITGNYAGYVYSKAFSILNSSGAITRYVVIIYYNDKPVGLEFDSTGTFIKVLEQSEKDEWTGNGWHHGRFSERNGIAKDTIALTLLPQPVQSYLKDNYPGDTLIKAFLNRDSSYVVLSGNNGLFATVFDINANFVKRIELPSNQGICVGIEQTDLPAVVLSYLNSTYPNYVFKKAFSLIGHSGVKEGYAIFIDANNSKYALEFDEQGNFVKVKTVY